MTVPTYPLPMTAIPRSFPISAPNAFHGLSLCEHSPVRTLHCTGCTTICKPVNAGRGHSSIRSVSGRYVDHANQKVSRCSTRSRRDPFEGSINGDAGDRPCAAGLFVHESRRPAPQVSPGSRRASGTKTPTDPTSSPPSTVDASRADACPGFHRITRSRPPTVTAVALPPPSARSAIEYATEASSTVMPTTRCFARSRSSTIPRKRNGSVSASSYPDVWVPAVVTRVPRLRPVEHLAIRIRGNEVLPRHQRRSKWLRVVYPPARRPQRGPSKWVHNDSVKRSYMTSADAYKLPEVPNVVSTPLTSRR